MTALLEAMGLLAGESFRQQSVFPWHVSPASPGPPSCSPRTLSEFL